jgi:hypothetical protein
VSSASLKFPPSSLIDLFDAILFEPSKSQSMISTQQLPFVLHFQLQLLLKLLIGWQLQSVLMKDFQKPFVEQPPVFAQVPWF